MGGERFDTQQPEAFLFGENTDLNFLGSRPSAVREEVIMLRFVYAVTRGEGVIKTIVRNQALLFVSLRLDSLIYVVVSIPNTITQRANANSEKPG